MSVTEIAEMSETEMRLISSLLLTENIISVIFGIIALIGMLGIFIGTPLDIYIWTKGTDKRRTPRRHRHPLPDKLVKIGNLKPGHQAGLL
jgi:hypothetical protein